MTELTQNLMHPPLIQGGMGIGISNYKLANSVARTGCLGVVSGTCIDSLLVRRLGMGDIGGHIKRAFDAFPDQEFCKQVWDKFFDSKGAGRQKFKLIALPKLELDDFRKKLISLASFCEVWLAKEGHTGAVGLNLLTKISQFNLPALYGAILAGVDYILMGAGIPREIPEAIRRLTNHEEAKHSIDIETAGKSETEYMTFDPRKLFSKLPKVSLPKFLPIVSSHILAASLLRSAPDIAGFIIENSKAGGHNTPPRNKGQFDADGEPVYGARDEADLEKMKELGKPFWLAGEYGSPEKYEEAREAGAVGVQIGTLFALSQDSGMESSLRGRILNKIINGTLKIKTDMRASPTSFPFKVMQIDGTMANAEVGAKRPRICDLGYLRTPFKDAEGKINFRCPAEPVDQYVKKGGDAKDCEGRMCLCNGLFSTAGYAQEREQIAEPPVVTSGQGMEQVKQFILSHGSEYTAESAIRYVLGKFLPRQVSNMFSNCSIPESKDSQVVASL